MESQLLYSTLGNRYRFGSVRRYRRSTFFQRGEKSGVLFSVSFPIRSFGINFRVSTQSFVLIYVPQPGFLPKLVENYFFSPALFCAFPRHFSVQSLHSEKHKLITAETGRALKSSVLSCSVLNHRNLAFHRLKPESFD